MAFALRNQNESDAAPMADINVTPLVDVMLVLLIVFMVAAPLMAVGVPVDLPKVQAKQLNDQKPPIAVSIDADGNFFVDQKPVSTDSLFDELNAVSENDKERRIHVRGDKNVTYGKVIEAMGKINGAGFTKVALVSEAPSSPAATKPAQTQAQAR
jgi:biopolymer transport protein ExbD/biopolymer transport protein TolR